jgi:hypothetical protein
MIIPKLNCHVVRTVIFTNYLGSNSASLSYYYVTMSKELNFSVSVFNSSVNGDDRP